MRCSRICHRPRKRFLVTNRKTKGFFTIPEKTANDNPFFMFIFVLGLDATPLTMPKRLIICERSLTNCMWKVGIKTKRIADPKTVQGVFR